MKCFLVGLVASLLLAYFLLRRLKMNSLFLSFGAFVASSALVYLPYIFVFKCFDWSSALKCEDKKFALAILFSLYTIPIALILMFTFAVFYVSYPKEGNNDNEIIRRLDKIEKRLNSIPITTSTTKIDDKNKN